MSKSALSKEEERRLVGRWEREARQSLQSLRGELLRLRADYLADGHTAEEWNDICEAVIARHKPLNVDLVKDMKIWDWRQAMNKIIEVLLYPFTELAGALVMRDLRRWARGYRFESEVK